MSFDIHKGEFVALIGQNGSGKTTVCKTCGAAQTDGRTNYYSRIGYPGYTVADLARHVGLFCNNRTSSFFAETVEDEIAFGPKNLGWMRIIIKKHVSPRRLPWSV